jgi:AraC family transcriptional regulator, regulatory protein of adaptative response / DNA-3-methyladenine glycosylase II
MPFELEFRAPYDWDALVAFLGARAIAGVEEISGDAYRRALRIEQNGTTRAGWIVVSPIANRPALRVELSSSLDGAVAPVLEKIAHVMDLRADPHEIAAVLGRIARKRPGLRVPGSFEGFEVAVRAIVGQQISVKAARTIAGRFATAFGAAIDTPFAGVTRLFPGASDVAALEPERIGELGITRTRARTILALAQALSNGTLRLDPSANVETTLASLCELPGIAEWTAQYLAMRALAWRDAFPHTDLGLMRALHERNAKRVLEMAEAWRPWRAYAVMHLWLSHT